MHKLLYDWVIVIKNLCKIYNGYKLDDCAQFLGNSNPLTNKKNLIYKNLNRLFFFISLDNNDQNNSDLFQVSIQISLSHYIIGLIIHNLLLDKTKYEKDYKIASDEKQNKLIHTLIEKLPKNLNDELNYHLVLIYSNNNAILDPFSYSVKIMPLTFVILLILNRFENDPSLFFLNNDYVSFDAINLILASLHITF